MTEPQRRRARSEQKEQRKPSQSSRRKEPLIDQLHTRLGELKASLSPQAQEFVNSYPDVTFLLKDSTEVRAEAFESNGKKDGIVITVPKSMSSKKVENIYPLAKSALETLAASKAR